MKEVIESLNLPKQILDKTEKFISKLFGSAITEFGELLADNVRSRRFKNQVKILNKTRELLDKNGLEPRELNLKTLVPLIEKSSIEENELLQDKWSNLIANIATTPENGLEPRLVNTLSSLSSLEAKIMDFIYEDFFIQRQLKFVKLLNRLNLLEGKKYTEEDVKLMDITIRFNSVKQHFDLKDEFPKIYIDNLESLGLLRYEEPEIEIDDGSTYADLVDDKVNGQSVDLNLEISASYMSSDDFHLTSFGKYFVEQCKNEK